MSTHLHEVRDTDTHFKIDAITRTITNFNEVKNTLFVGDHESEIFTFEMPRYTDGHDMSLCDVVQIHYLNQGSGNSSVPGIYEVDDLDVVEDSEEETIIFSWKISRNATQLAGSLNFAMHFACTEDGEEVYVWNTDVHTGIVVKATLSNSEVIVETNADILEQWREQLFGAGESALNKIETAKTEAIEYVKQTAKDETTIAVGEVVDKAVEDIQKFAAESATSAATEAATNAAEEVKQLIQTAGQEQITAIGTAKDQATEAITQEKTQSIEDIKQSATSSATEAANKAATDATNSVKQSIQTAGQEQITAIGTAKDNAVQSVEQSATQAAQNATQSIQESGQQQITAIGTAKDQSVQSANQAIETKKQEEIESIEQFTDNLLGDYEDITEMIEELDFKKAASIVATESGEKIRLIDSSDKKLSGLRVYGKSEEIKKKGNQLFDASKIGTTSSGGATVTNNGDGSFTISGSGNLTQNFSHGYEYSREESKKLLKPGTIKCKMEATSIYCYFKFIDKNGLSVEVNNGGYEGNTELPVTEEDINSSNFKITIGFYGSANSEIPNATIRPMIYQDGDGTWEPFTGGEPFVSPTHPQDILSAGQRLSTGKNLCSATDLEVAASQTVTFEKPIPAGTYAISGVVKSSDTDSDTCLLMFYYSDGTTKEVEIPRSSAEERKSTTTTFAKEVTKVIVYAGSNYNGSSGDTATFSDMQIESGSTATEYEPYTGGVPGLAEGEIEVNIESDESSAQAQTFTVSSPNGLPGIPVEFGGNYTDESGKQWICDVKDYESGKYYQHIKKVIFDGSEDENFVLSKYSNGFLTCYIDLENSLFYNTSNFVICSSFENKDANSWSNPTENAIIAKGISEVAGRIGFAFDGASTVNEFKTFLQSNPMTLYHAISSPIITDIPAEEIAAYKELHTNYPNTDIFTNEEVEPGIEVDYTADTKKYISERMVETVITSIRSDLATVYEENYTWGFVEHMDILSPDNRIEYECLNRNYRPMSIDKNEHQTDYGSWGKFPSLVNNKPYMVKSSGEEDYLLDENDYTKKYDGTDSDVSNTEYDGGAFSKFIKVYVKRWIEGNDRHVRFSFIPIEGYTPCGFIDEDGREMDHVWIPMFYGSTVGGKMRSLSGLQPDINQNTATQNTNIKAFSNRAAFFAGPIVETIRDMLFMLFKTTDIQAACGNGNRSGYVSTASPYYGVLPNAVVDGGQFYGTTDGKSLNKIFHSIVLATYNQYQRDPYFLCVNGRFKVSTDYTFDLTGESYIDTGIDSPTVDENKWIYPYKSKVIDGFGSIPVEPMTASTSTGYCDGVYCPANKDFVAVVRRFAGCGNGSTAGVSALALDASAGAASWSIAASVLLRPPVAA